MNRLSRLLDLTLTYVLEPGVNWVIDHPIISVLVVVAMVFWSMRAIGCLTRAHAAKSRRSWEFGEFSPVGGQCCCFLPPGHK